MLIVDDKLYFAFHGHRPGEVVECQVCELGIEVGADLADGRVA